MVSQPMLFPQEPPRFDREEFHRLLEHAKSIEASDIHIKTLTRIMCRVHGQMVPVTNRRLEEAEVSALCRILYGADNAELEVRTGKPLDGAYMLRLNRESALRFRWNASGCEVRGAFGIKLTLRELPEMPPLLPREDFDPQVLEGLFPENGLVMICGATGSGKSTLMAGIIREIAKNPEAHANILTLEAPIEFTYDKVATETCMITQSSVPHNFRSFDAGIISFLRGDPDIIIVGESRDAATIKAANLASQTGHAVYTTVHSNTVGTTFLRLMQSLPPEETASELGSLIEATRLIICQRLYPSTDGRRVAVRETLVFDHRIRRELLSVAARNISELPAAADDMVRRYGRTMLQHAELLVAAGRLDPAYVELLRADELRGSSPARSDAGTAAHASRSPDTVTGNPPAAPAPIAAPTETVGAFASAGSDRRRPEPLQVPAEEATAPCFGSALSQFKSGNATVSECVEIPPTPANPAAVPECHGILRGAGVGNASPLEDAAEAPGELEAAAKSSGMDKSGAAASALVLPAIEGPSPRMSLPVPLVMEPLDLQGEKVLAEAVDDAIARPGREPAMVTALVPVEGEPPWVTARRRLLIELCDALAQRLEADAPELEALQAACDFGRSLAAGASCSWQEVRSELHRHLTMMSQVLAPLLAGEAEFLKERSVEGEVPDWALVRHVQAFLNEPSPPHPVTADAT